jgi:hypothetical protein
MKTIEAIYKAISKINPDAQASMSGDNISALDTITWENGTPPIAKELILAKVAELQAEYEANQYQRDRVKDYPSLADQLDMQYWDKINGTNKWQQAINAVKQKYPK